MNLQSGQNIPLQQSTIRLNLQYPAKSGFKGEPDTCLFMLNAQGKVSGDSDFIFYNNLSSPEGAVRLVTGSQQASIEIALDRVPANVSKIAITVVIDGEDTISSGCTLTDKMAIEKVPLTYLDLVVARW
ncbi:TerD family protein [Escherichia coli]|nr:TerD family protein [Escherichia coli]EER5928034.1 TerD family protein [Escherichia coli]EFG2459997.1 TerD family protein [Escherichia coli]EFK0654450.1 TerD family protein [Escherichia coli]